MDVDSNNLGKELWVTTSTVVIGGFLRSNNCIATGV